MIKKSKKNVLNTARNPHDDRELVLNPFKSALFPLKSTTGTGLKNINSQTIASKITDSSCTSKSR